MRWWWQKKETTTDEAKEHLQRLIEREPEVKKISRELKDAQARNHFSDMVAIAMARRSRGEQ